MKISISKNLFITIIHHILKEYVLNVENGDIEDLNAEI
jgi:hypothetical protein